MLYHLESLWTAIGHREVSRMHHAHAKYDNDKNHRVIVMMSHPAENVSSSLGVYLKLEEI